MTRLDAAAERWQEDACCRSLGTGMVWITTCEVMREWQEEEGGRGRSRARDSSQAPRCRLVKGGGKRRRRRRKGKEGMENLESCNMPRNKRDGKDGNESLGSRGHHSSGDSIRQRSGSSRPPASLLSGIPFMALPSSSLPGEGEDEMQRSLALSPTVWRARIGNRQLEIAGL
jgi:hypothetical protein